MSCTRGRTTIETPDDYWSAIVVPDYKDYKRHPGDLRQAFHCAIALFHMADWVYVTNKEAINASRAFVDLTGKPIAIDNEKSFANAIESISPEFGLIRKVANTAKHLELRDKTDHPWHSANTGSQLITTAQHYAGYFYPGTWMKAPGVVVEPHIDFAQTATAVYELWPKLRTQHGW